MLLTRLRNVLLVASLSTTVLGHGRENEDAVTFTFTDCALACIDAAGFSTALENEQESLCEASRNGLLERVEECMLSKCPGRLPDVDQDLLTPTQTGCEEIGKPVPEWDIEEAEAAAALIIAIMSTPTTDVQSSTTSPPTTSTAQEVSISVQAAFSSEKPTTGADISTQIAPTSRAQSISSAEKTSAVAISAELTPTTTIFIKSTLTSMIVSQALTDRVQTVLQTSGSQDTNGQFKETSTPATQLEVTSTVSDQDKTTRATVIPTKAPEKNAANTATSPSNLTGDRTSAASSTTASSTSDDSLVMETEKPAASTRTSISFVTSTTARHGSHSTSTLSSSSTEEDGIGGGSPFSTSNAASKQCMCGLSIPIAVIATLSVVM